MPHRSLCPLLAAALLAGCAPKPVNWGPAAPQVVHWRDQVDWKQAGDDVTALLQGYLRVDTLNPPGNELAGAQYLAQILEKEGIPAEVTEWAPGRANVIGRLKAQNPTQAPLCLLSHIDVASAEAERWPEGKGPLSGTLDEDGFLWGRGALDMKSLGAMELQTVLLLKRGGAPLTRDIVFVAVGDEEVDNTGAQVLAKDWAKVGCSHLINEGGLGIQNAIVDGHTLFAISFVEKGVFWAHLVAEGNPGHGSTPKPNESPARLMAAVDKIAKRKTRVTLPDWMYTTLDGVGRVKGGALGAVLRSRFLVNLLVKPRLVKNHAVKAGLTNTIHVTGFGGAKEPNVVAAKSWANLDCRLLPGVDPQDFQKEVEKLVKGDGISLEIVQTASAEASPIDDPLYKALARYAVEGRTDASVGPVLAVGYTDSIVLRPLGVKAYGFSPLELTQELAETMHGDNERVSKDALGAGLRRLYSAVVDVSVAP